MCRSQGRDGWRSVAAAAGSVVAPLLQECEGGCCSGYLHFVWVVVEAALLCGWLGAFCARLCVRQGGGACVQQWRQGFCRLPQQQRFAAGACRILLCFNIVLSPVESLIEGVC